MTDGVDDGLYEALRTRGLERRLQAVPEGATRFGVVDRAAVPEVLARHVADVVRRALGGGADAAAVVNRVVAALVGDGADDAVVALEQLLAVSVAPGVHRVVRPTTPLSDTALLTNTPDEPALGTELAAEMDSADRVDLLCAFVKYHGIRLLADELGRLRERGVPLRVITTTYLGGTDRVALDRLVREFGAEVRVRYEQQTTRLHAKAWLFRRRSGFDTGYVGSSNLSKSALVDGLEWNVRISSVATPTLVRKFEATFDTYWNNPEFRPYDPARDAETLDRALGAQAGSGATVLALSGLEVRARPHQERILEALDAERTVHGRRRNLVVAATGTGKTVVAALDFRRLGGTERSLLFVAHRRELLEQARRTYREVLGDGTFGELLVAGQRPVHWRHVFASVQSLREADLPHAFDVAVIDEFHHAEAPSYRHLLERLSAGELLGLTATPDRADGVDVRAFFDGRVAVEIGLAEALEQDLLAPFHYFGVADNTDLRALEWTRGTYDAGALDVLYTGNRARTLLILKALRDRVAAPERMRGLGFCVTVRHAQEMAAEFTRAGIPARAVTGETPADERADAASALRRGEVACLFTVDLYNEGVDLPFVDTVLFLRPTQSATVFLQQLGRGLRRAPGKAVLTVLDFIGAHRREFRFDTRFRALTGSTRTGVAREVEQGFPTLPSGCRILLDPVAHEVVLDNVRQGRLATRKALVAEVRAHGDLPLPRYLERSGTTLPDVYRRGSWTGLRRDAGFPTLPAGSREAELLKRVGKLVHVDDRERAATYMRLLLPGCVPYAQLDAADRAAARMLVHTVWPDLGGHAGFDEALATLRAHPAVVAEIGTLVRLGADTARHVPGDLGIDGVALRSHCTYRRPEILAGIGWADGTRRVEQHREGVVFAEATNVDALLVTLRKEDKDFAPSTRYRDYPLSASLFAWESQNKTTLASAAGRRYVEGTSSVILFVRAAVSDAFGDGAPYVCLGAASLDEHRGERPIAITWRLDRPMPVEVLQAGAVDAA